MIAKRPKIREIGKTGLHKKKTYYHKKAGKGSKYGSRVTGSDLETRRWAGFWEKTRTSGRFVFITFFLILSKS